MCQHGFLGYFTDVLNPTQLILTARTRNDHFRWFDHVLHAWFTKLVFPYWCWTVFKFS